MRQAVKKFQIHKHQAPHCQLGEDGRCSDRFPMDLCSTCQNTERDRYIYTRLTDEDRWVVPYNPTVLAMWQAQMNLQVLPLRVSVFVNLRVGSSRRRSAPSRTSSLTC